MIFLSIFCATLSAERTKGMIANLEETADDPSSFEVLIKLDEGCEALAAELEAFRPQTKVQFKYLITPKLQGYYSLHKGYDALFTVMAPESYFCWLFNDEIRVKSKGWDTAIKKYVGFFSDDIFRLKVSVNKMRNYYAFRETLPCPENYAVTTRKWLDVTGGWGEFWGPDSWHQAIDYCLGLCENKHEWIGDFPGIYRSFPIFDVEISNEETAVGVEGDALVYRAKKINGAYQQMQTIEAQENFMRLAQRLNIHIWTHYERESGNPALQKDGGEIIDDVESKRLELYSRTGKLLGQWSYDLYLKRLLRDRVGVRPALNLKNRFSRGFFKVLWPRVSLWTRFFLVSIFMQLHPVARLILGPKLTLRLKEYMKTLLGLPLKLRE